jgi:translation initiation factor 1A
MGRRKSKGQHKNKPSANIKRELEYKDDGQEYAKVIKMLGQGRCTLQCFDGVERLGHIRGALRNKVWINLHDFVLVGLREYQDNKCDILMKYTSEEVRNLKSYGELPSNVSLAAEKEEETDESMIDFDDI